ncbi:mannose-1-phosphate guanylyltransferase [Brachybacterium sp. p3-SID957]|uniref:mannose-1-phosphate guanylyltransferase n=1 Tax=Brachybacterium sp. p3-SID957 TaxID=2916049 RepID=UPI00223C4B79|nr:mannose-1-phosphate guanylyltransferase [Brachybacterium sp. p3-SID957]MCT1777048.1 sugar phosphate nucleotidyltransferase [Brachybacterium sp. p3-SID957]
MSDMPFVPVIPAGGAGTRLWPLSRSTHPKFLLDLTGSGSSLLQQTLARLAPLADRPPVIVTGSGHAHAVQQQVAEAGATARVLTEPTPRNSMPAIALAAAVVEREEPTAVIGSFAADHLIADTQGFAESVRAARRAAELGHLVTLGIQPTHPATGFGYIEQAPASDGHGAEGGGAGDPAQRQLRAAGARPVVRFVEKPDAALAEEFLTTGRFLWNAGMFTVGAGVLLDALAEQIPPLAAGVRSIAAARGTAQEREVMERLWPTLTSIAIDHALAEPLAAAGRVAVVPASFDWDDVGDFAALARQLRARAGTREEVGVRRDGSDVQVLGTARVDAVDSRATVYGATHRHVALVGLDGVSVVDTEDVLLVLADDHAQDLGTLVGRLPQVGLDHLR